MSRSVAFAILLCLFPAVLTARAEDTPALADDACRAPFVLLVPAEFGSSAFATDGGADVWEPMLLEEAL